MGGLFITDNNGKITYPIHLAVSAKLFRRDVHFYDYLFMSVHFADRSFWLSACISTMNHSLWCTYYDVIFSPWNVLITLKLLITFMNCFLFACDMQHLIISVTIKKSESFFILIRLIRFGATYNFAGGFLKWKPRNYVQILSVILIK